MSRLTDALIRLAREIGISVTDPEEIALYEALIEIYVSEGFGGRENDVRSREDAERLVAERLAWLRDQRAEGLR